MSANRQKGVKTRNGALRPSGQTGHAGAELNNTEHLSSVCESVAVSDARRKFNAQS